MTKVLKNKNLHRNFGKFLQQNIPLTPRAAPSTIGIGKSNNSTNGKEQGIKQILIGCRVRYWKPAHGNYKPASADNSCQENVK